MKNTNDSILYPSTRNYGRSRSITYMDQKIIRDIIWNIYQKVVK